MKKMGFVFAAMIAMVGSATVLADSHKGNSYVHDMAYLTIHVAVSGKEWSNEAIVEYGRQLNKLIAYYNNHEGAYLISQFSHNLNAYAYGMEHHPEQLEVCGAGNGFQIFDVTDDRNFINTDSVFVQHGCVESLISIIQRK